MKTTYKINKIELGHALLRKGWSITDLAKNLGVSRQSLYASLGEKTERLTFKKIYAIARALEVDPVTLIIE